MSDIGRDFWEAALVMTPAAQQYRTLASITSPYDHNPIDLTVFVSCYNEEDSIAATLETLTEAMSAVDKSYEIIVIDDNSHDRSTERVREFIATHADLPIILRINKVNRGLAQNYLDAAFMGCGTYYRLVRGNNSEPIEMMADIFRAVGDADIIVPYFISMRHEGRGDRFFSQLYSNIINSITGNRINYYHGAHVHLRYNVMRWHPNTTGSVFQTDLLCRLLEQGFTCKQAPCRANTHIHPGKRFTFGQMLSLLHVMLDIVLRRMSNRLHKRG